MLMRMIALVVAVSSVLATSSLAEARGRRPTRHGPKRAKDRVAVDAPARRAESTPRVRDRSIGAPWSGRLTAPAKLPRGEGYVIRRPWRAFGTKSTVEFIHEAVVSTLEAFPKHHVYAVGDLSAETGGQITEHRSHQLGRDADLGLFYKKKPAGYPENFVRATETNLDCAATWKLISELARTAEDDGGMQVMFLDYEVQGLLYKWAKQAKISEKRLDRILQYPYGKGSGNGLVRHEPNHDNHLHVRFKCRERDTACR